MARRQRDPLGPLDMVVSVLTTLAVGWIVFLVVMALLPHTHVSFGALGEARPCLQVTPASVTNDGGAAVGGYRVQDLRPGVTVASPRQWTLCNDMGAADRAWVTLAQALDVLWSLGILVVLRRLITDARVGGLFTRRIARGTTMLGAYLLVGHLAVVAVRALETCVVFGHMVTGGNAWGSLLLQVHPSLPIIVAGFGVLSIGRVMECTVPLREEVEATV